MQIMHRSPVGANDADSKGLVSSDGAIEQTHRLNPVAEKMARVEDIPFVGLEQLGLDQGKLRRSRNSSSKKGRSSRLTGAATSSKLCCGGTFVDEYRLWIFPMVVGAGKLTLKNSNVSTTRRHDRHLPAGGRDRHRIFCTRRTDRRGARTPAQDRKLSVGWILGRPRCGVLGEVLTLGTIGTRLRPVIRKRSCDMGQCSCVHSGAVANTTKWHRSMKPARR